MRFKMRVICLRAGMLQAFPSYSPSIHFAQRPRRLSLLVPSAFILPDLLNEIQSTLLWELERSKTALHPLSQQEGEKVRKNFVCIAEPFGGWTDSDT